MRRSLFDMIFLIRAGPPTITQCGNQTLTEGNSLSWTCHASGTQPLNISWFKGQENTIVSSTKTYNITSVSRSHHGMYRFTVSNGDECPTASTSVYLTVQCEYSIIECSSFQCGYLVRAIVNITL